MSVAALHHRHHAFKQNEPVPVISTLPGRDMEDRVRNGLVRIPKLGKKYKIVWLRVM